MYFSPHFQGLLKEWRNTQELAQMGNMEGKPTTTPPSTEPPQLMGATGPLVLIPEPTKKPTEEQAAPAASASRGPERKSVRRKVTIPGGGQAANGQEDSQGGGTSLSRSTSHSSAAGAPSPDGLQKAESKISISQISMGAPASLARPEVPELSYGVNSRMPSASLGIDLRFAGEKGRYFVATQDLLPGKLLMHSTQEIEKRKPPPLSHYTLKARISVQQQCNVHL
mgnify:CR=1 FL=1